jgi:hypothetical protein
MNHEHLKIYLKHIWNYTFTIFTIIGYITIGVFLVSAVGLIGPFSKLWNMPGGCQTSNFTEAKNFGLCIWSGCLMALMLTVLLLLTAILVYNICNVVQREIIEPSEREIKNLDNSDQHF